MVSEEKRKAIIDMADFAASMFLYILAEHEDSSTPANCDPTHKPSRRRKHRKHKDMVKPITKFRNFCVQILFHTRRSPSTIILSLRFLHQIVSNLRDEDKRLTSKRRYERRFFIGVLILADKFHNDGSLNNDCWSWLTGISLGKIHSIERQFLEILDYKIFVCAEDYTEWLACLVGMTKRHMPTQISVALEQQSIAAAAFISIDRTTTTKEPTPSIPKTITKVVPKTIAKVVPQTIAKVVPQTIEKVVPQTIAKVVPQTTAKVVPQTIAKVVPKTIAKVVSPTPPVIQQDQGSSRRSNKASGSNRHPHLSPQKDGQGQRIEQSNSSKAHALKSTGRAANAAGAANTAGAANATGAASAGARHPTKATTSKVPRTTNPARP